jgi:hypothetical protein
MQTERDLRARLRKIEALFAGAGTSSERMLLRQLRSLLW